MTEKSAVRLKAEFESWRQRNTRRLETALKKHLAKAGQGQPEAVARLVEAMGYTLTSGGKRVRPLLAFAASEAVGGQAREALPAAVAVEMIHAYSLIHDDLPAMDDDDLRRGRPTNHKVFGEAAAILAGDALLTMSFQVLAESSLKSLESARRSALAALHIARLAGAAGMVGGQALDMALEDRDGRSGGPELAELVRDMEKRKTGALMAAAASGGAAFGGGSAAELRALSRIGFTLGLFFQIQDDLLNIQGDQALLGKAVGSDRDRGKTTLLTTLGPEQAAREMEQLAAQVRRLAAGFKLKGLRLLQITESLMGRRY